MVVPSGRTTITQGSALGSVRAIQPGPQPQPLELGSRTGKASIQPKNLHACLRQAPPRTSFARRHGCPSLAAHRATKPCSSARTRLRRAGQGPRQAAVRCGTIVTPFAILRHSPMHTMQPNLQRQARSLRH